MRVGVSGGPGIGKSTLAAALARSLCMQVIPEGIREWLAEHQIVNPDCLSSTQQISLQGRYLKFKLETEASLPRFISDRTVIDGLLILQQRVSALRDCELAPILCAAEAHAKTRYDVILVPPFYFYGDTDPARPHSVALRRREHDAIRRYIQTNRIPFLQLRSFSLSGWIDQSIEYIYKCRPV